MENYNTENENNQDLKVDSNFLYMIENHEIVKVSRQGNKFAEVVYCMKRNNKARIKKIDKDTYVHLESGEIRQFNHKEGKEDINSLKNTFKRLIGLIRCNFTEGANNQLFITLTYAENMTDTKKLYRDFEIFYKRLKRKYKEHNFQYVVVAEPQERGAWHFHLMLKSDKSLYIPDSKIRELWGHGFTSTERLKSDDVGTYYVAYFTNLEVECSNDENKEGKSKKYIKGSRLHYYPKGFNFYRSSRGLKKPDVLYMPWGEVVKQYGNPIWQGSYSFYVEEDGLRNEKNLIHKATFKKQK